MILLFASVLAATPPPASAECYGVAVETQNGLVNLTYIDAYGPKEDVAKVTEAALRIGVQAKEIRPAIPSPEGEGVHIPFMTPRVSGRAATDLVTRLRKGEFGALKDHLGVMGIETLPADKCPRS
jgi:hypothetical protein